MVPRSGLVSVHEGGISWISLLLPRGNSKFTDVMSPRPPTRIACNPRKSLVCGLPPRLLPPSRRIPNFFMFVRQTHDADVPGGVYFAMSVFSYRPRCCFLHELYCFVASFAVEMLSLEVSYLPSKRATFLAKCVAFFVKCVAQYISLLWLNLLLSFVCSRCLTPVSYLHLAFWHAGPIMLAMVCLSLYSTA